MADPASVSAFLVIIVIVMTFLIAGAVVLMMIKFGHPDDKNVAKLPKLVTFLGLWLAFASVLIVPYDVANSRGVGGGIRVDILWQIVYISIAVLCFGLIPFAVFFYESDTDPEQAKKGGCCASQTGQAVCYTSVFFIVFATILVILYATMGTADLPVTHLQQAASNRTLFAVVPNATVGQVPLDGCNDVQAAAKLCTKETFHWNIPVTFPIFAMGLMSLIGWFFFTFFVGVGLVALPMDLINEWRTKPAPMSTKIWVEEKLKLAARAAILIDLGTQFKEQLEKGEGGRSQKRADKKNFLKFEQNYYFLKKDFQMLDLCHRLKGGNPLWYILKLVCGILGVAISLTWIIHIAVFVLPDKPFHPFLNTYFVELETIFGSGFPLFGITAFSTWSFYLLWCCVKGNFKLGVRFFFWKIYPMEVNGTFMNAFLVNTWFILLCSIPTVQFCTTSFPIYTRYTDIDMLFGTQVQYLKYLSYFWQYNIFVIVMLGVSFLTLVLLCVRPNDKAAEIEAQLQAISKKSNLDL